MQLTSRYGALYVVEQAHTKDYVQRRLKELDDRLFLEKQMTLQNEEVWCVCVDVGLGNIFTILEWRDEHGGPIQDLTEGIVARVAAMERDHKRLLARVVEQNARMVEEKRRDADHAYEEVGRDAERMMSPGHSALFPRGQYLRMHRDRLRAQGYKV